MRAHNTLMRSPWKRLLERDPLFVCDGCGWETDGRRAQCPMCWTVMREKPSAWERWCERWLVVFWGRG